MDQLDEKLSEIQHLLSQLSDVTPCAADSVDKNPENVDGMLNTLLSPQKNDHHINNRYPRNEKDRYNDEKNSNNDCNNIVYDRGENDASDTLTFSAESESSEEESADEIVEAHTEQKSPQNNNRNSIKNQTPTTNKSFDSSINNPPPFASSNNNGHFDVVSVVSKPNSRVDVDLDYIISEPNDVDISAELEPYDSVSNAHTDGLLYSTTSETYAMSEDVPNNEGYNEPGPTSTSIGDQITTKLLVSEPPENTCCTCFGGCCRECILRTGLCLWFLVSSILFILDIYSDLCLAVHYTMTYHHIWASLTFVLFFLPWVFNIYSFYKFNRCKRKVWERWCGGFFLLLGLYPVFRSLIALLDNLYERRHNKWKRNPSDPENNGTNAAEIFMTTILLQDIPQLFLQFFIVGRRNAIEAPAMFSIVTSFLCIVITISSGFAAITQGQHEWMSDNVEMFLLQPCQEKILQSRILKNEWKDFYNSSPTFDPLLLEVERSKEKLKTRMASLMAVTKPASFSQKWKYYTSSFPIYVLMTLSFVPSVSFFASLEEVKFPWMALVVYFTVHLYVTWSLLCCRGAIYLPIHKLRRPLINYTLCKCACRACAMRVSFVLQILFILLANALVSVWCSSTAYFVAQASNSSTLQCLPSYIWPNTLPVLKTFRVVLVNNTNITSNTVWFSCQANYASSQRIDNIFNLAIDWVLTFQICISDHVTVVYWLVTVSSALLLVYHFLLVCQPRVEVSLDQQTQLWRGIFDERKNLWDKIGEEQKTMKAWDRAKASKTIQRNEVWYTTVNKCVYSKWKKKSTPV